MVVFKNLSKGKEKAMKKFRRLGVLLILMLTLNIAADCGGGGGGGVGGGGPCTDTDNDSFCDNQEQCPNDSLKQDPGECGCGIADEDTDGDTVANCNDPCLTDPNKIFPGECGCGQPDVDLDGDTMVDCTDDCPGDPLKTAPGICGCGVADVDTDGDGSLNCEEDCPADPGKITAGVCGCGVPDQDTDNDGNMDCNDLCADDPLKTAPGICGCGVADDDTDTDGVFDCNDPCPTDMAKVNPGQCGCNVADTDSDGDTTPDCNDGCVTDSNKTAPGICGCNVLDTDSDGDTTPDCNDLCDFDNTKISPGQCGCNNPDTDSDGDLTADCNDQCPADADKIDPEVCGCGIIDDDIDGDSIIDCHFTAYTPGTVNTASGLVSTVFEQVDYSPDISFAFDSLDYIRIIYGDEIEKSMGLLANINNIWKLRIFWDNSTLAGENSIALDNNNKSHISVTTFDGDSSMEGLLYITDVGGQFSSTVCDDRKSTGLENDIIVDSSGNVHISQYIWSTKSLRYTTNSSGFWQSQDLGLVNWGETNIMLDSNNKLHFVTGNTDAYAYHYYQDPVDYTVEQIPVIHIFVQTSALIDEDVLYVLTQGGLAVKDSGVWTFTEIYDGTGFNKYKIRIDEDSLAIDSNNKLHVGITLYQQLPGDTQEYRYFFYLTNISGTWQSKLIDKFLPVEIGVPPAIAVDSNNYVYYLYVNSENNMLQLVSFDPSTF